MIGKLKSDAFRLKRIFIETHLPEELAPLQEMAGNLWWSWNKGASELFRYIMPEKWVAHNYNPISVLDEMSAERAQELLEDKDFMKKLKSVSKEYQKYMEEKAKAKGPKVAYFCMEYGLHISVRLYSGGLGILAGDFLKEASDMNVDMVAVGLLYRYGYFQQSISLHGDQISNYPAQKFTVLPMVPVRNDEGEWLKVMINLKGRTVLAKVWEMKVGRIALYLLDTDFDENSWEDRNLTHQLYGGDNEHRLKQEILLGIGGARALKAMGIKADVYHCNEGHAAFMGIERLKDHIQQDQLTFEEAEEVVRSSSLFTTHTPVPAGHDYFTEDLLRNYMHPYTDPLGISWHEFVALGKIDPDDPNEMFSMSHLAIRLSQEVNGVSKLHGSVSQKMFNVLYSGYNPEELHIGYVTNSVHYPTWIAPEWHKILTDLNGEKFIKDQSNKDLWSKVRGLSAQDVMAVRNVLKEKLIAYLKAKLQEDLTRRGEKPAAIFEVLNKVNSNALIFGFARRFATYKRAHLLFTNLDRLAEIVNDPDRPVMFLFAGKAHPADQGGQALIKRIIEVSQHPDFIGKVIFLEGYNMEMAKLLVRGVDIWVNTPTRPKEASGTSGMKAAMNGVMNFSVLDGWWAEGYQPDAGWALPLERAYEDQSLQDELDAESIYNTLENDLIPKYFDRNEEGIPETWVEYIKNIMSDVAPYFTMKRMMDDYFDKFYLRLAERGAYIRKDEFKKAHEMSEWKKHMRRNWDAIEIQQMNVYDSDNFALRVGDKFTASITVDHKEINPEHVGLEVVFFKRIDENNLEIALREQLNESETQGNLSTYSCLIEPEVSGVYEYGFRMFPKHPDLPHKQDLQLVRWL
jgi:starch phosphorylase